MSTNIDEVNILFEDNFRIRGDKLAELYEGDSDNLRPEEAPEGSIFDELPIPVFDYTGVPKEGKRHPDMSKDVKPWRSEKEYQISMQWYGEGSGRGVDFLIQKVLPRTLGKIDFVLQWEGGGLQGVRVEDGKVTECEVQTILVPKTA